MVRHVFAMTVKLLAIIPEDNFRSLGPTPSKPVAFDTSRVDKT